MTIKTFCNCAALGACGLTFAGSLAGCGDSNNDAAADAPVVVAAAAPVVVVQGPPAVVGMIYYPSYEIYYDPDAHLYWYNENGGWIHGEQPRGITVEALVNVPSVRTGFQDSPANHHIQIAQQYPKNWQPDGRGKR